MASVNLKNVLATVNEAFAGYIAKRAFTKEHDIQQVLK